MSIDPAFFDRVVATDRCGSPVELRRTFGIAKSQIGHILGALVAESDAGNPGGLAFVEALATGLSQQVAVHAGACAPREARLRGGLSTVAKRRALELMDAQLDASLTVESLAREVGLSARTSPVLSVRRPAVHHINTCSRFASSARAGCSTRRTLRCQTSRCAPVSQTRRILPGSSSVSSA